MLRPSSLLPFVLSVAVMLTGCASFRTNNSATCDWLEVDAQPGLVASGQRNLSQGHVRPHACGTADLFTLKRQRYVLEMWNSEEISPLLYLRISTVEGTTLRLESPEIESTTVGGIGTHYEKGMRYQHVFRGHRLVEGRPRAVVFPHALVLSIVDDGDQVVGKESLTLLKSSGRFYFNEF